MDAMTIKFDSILLKSVNARQVIKAIYKENKEAGQLLKK